MGNPDCNLNQIPALEFKTFLEQGFWTSKSFFDQKILDSVVLPATKRLQLYEMEGKFSVRRPVSALQPANRSDKFFNFNLAFLESYEELKELKQLARLLFFLPFEINMKVQLNLQVSEEF